jgi:hypothetical protein
LFCTGMASSVDPAANTPAVGGGSGSSTGHDNSGLPQELSTGIDLGSIYTQCSTSRSAASTISVTEIKDGSGTASSITPALIGSLNWEGDNSVTKTFHGGRISKNGRITNECLSASFDPRNLHCLGCATPHHIINPLKPPVLIFADQNFVPFLSGGAENCIAVCRAENPTLGELGDLAAEILDRTLLPPGTTMLFGSGSHLFKNGTSQYASDWISLANRCSQKWPNTNICPLIPIVRSECPGHFARDIATLSTWLGRVYANSTTGLLDTWKALLQTTDSQCERRDSAEYCKIPLPSSISVGSVTSHTYAFYSSCPDTLQGVDRKATGELIRILIETLNRDFSANLNPDIIIASSWAGTGIVDTSDSDSDSDMISENPRHIVLVGASNMKRIIPLLQSSGYTVTDITSPGWLATAENIEHAICVINTLSLDPGYTLVMELFGNSTFRYQQFDGMMALPYKSQKGYHLPGKIGVSDNDSFLRTATTARDLLTLDGPDVRILIPPLPRYLFKGCCGQSDHSTNLGDEGYALQLLHDTLHFRPLLKTTLLELGLENFFVLDGVGALLGIPPGGNRGPATELLADLEKIMAADNVHYTELGYKNMCDIILAAIEQVRNGSLTKSYPVATGNHSLATVPTTKCNYFWRGFSSPVGHSAAKFTGAGGPGPHQHRGKESGGKGDGGGHPRGPGSKYGGGGGWVRGARGGFRGGRSRFHRGQNPRNDQHYYRGGHGGARKYHPY